MGLEEGLKKGRQEGLQEGIAVALEAKFGPPGRKLISRVRQIAGIARLRRLAKVIKTAPSIEDVRQHLRNERKS
jgi:predicted transposase YdaD